MKSKPKNTQIMEEVKIELPFPPEYELWLDENLNKLERFREKFSSTDEYLYLLIHSNIQILRAMNGLSTIFDPTPPPGDDGPIPDVPTINVNILRHAPVAQQIVSNMIVTAIGERQCQIMADCRWAKRVTLLIESSLDQALNVRIIGNMTTQVNEAIPFGGWTALPANDRTSIGCDVDIWLPYMGCIIDLAVAPTSGQVNAWILTGE